MQSDLPSEDPPITQQPTGRGTTGGRWEPPSPEELQVLLPQYQVSGFLGRGGMGAVYRGTQINLDRPVAIKILPPGMDDADDGANYAERFKNEARAMAKLSHPGIVAVYDSGETADGLLYIVMEFVEGTDVQKMVSTQGRLHSDHAMAITAHVCDALHYAHERGIVHRDIKPANIMVGYDGVVKVADFGLAKMSRAGESGLTRTGTAMGTLHYMAPEALTLGTSVDHRADVYAVGVMLYFMLTGRLPQGMFELPSMQISGLDPRFDRVISQALRDDRDVRFQSARAMRGELDAMLTQPVAKVDAEAKGRSSPPKQAPGSPGRPVFAAPPEQVARRGASPLLWGALMVMGALVIWMWLGRQPQRPQQASALPEVDTPPASPATTGTKPASKATTPSVQIEADGPVSTDLKAGVWHNLLDAPLFGLTGLEKTEDSSVEQPHYLAKVALHKAAPQVLRNCALRLRFSGDWQSEPTIFLRRPRETNVLESMSAKLEGYSARLSRHYPPNLIKPLVVAPLTAATARKKSVELEFRVEGHKYTLLRDGVMVAEATDLTYASGRVGVFLPQGTIVEKAEILLLPDTVDQPYAAGDWQPLLEGRPEIIQRLQITDEPSGWKVMQKGFAPLLNEKNVAVRFKARGHDLRIVARWSETAIKGVYGHTIRIGSDVNMQPCLFGGSVNTVITADGVLQPNTYMPWGAALFPVQRGQEYEFELRSFEDRVEVLADGKVFLSVREENLPGNTIALHPLRTVAFRDLVWRRLTPPVGGLAASPSGQSWTDSQGRRINATFVRLAGDQVIFNTQGRESTVALTALSPESRELATRLSAPTADKPASSAPVGAPAPASAAAVSAPMPAVPVPPPPATAVPSAGPPSWTDRKGRQIQAAFVRLEKDAVVVAMSGSGKETPLPFSTLSEESVRQAQALALGAAKTHSSLVAPKTGAFDEADSLIHRFTFNAAGETGADIQRASLKDGMLFLDGRYEYESANVAGSRAMLQCPSFTPEDFTLAIRLSRDRSKTILITGGYHDRSISGRGTPRWLSVSCESGGKLLVEIPSLNHKDVIEKADVPVGKPFTLVLAGNLKLGPVQVYLDGRRLATIPLIRDANAAPAPDLDDYLSFTHPGNRESLKGKVDELRMYGRTLQDSEVASLQLGGDQVLALSSPGKITTRSLPPRHALTTGLRNVEFPATAGGKDIGRYVDDLLDYDMGKDTAQIKIIGAELTNLLQDVAQEHFDQLLMALPRAKLALSTGKCEAVQQVALAHADPQNRTMIIQAMQYFPPMLEIIRAKGWATDALPSVVTTLDSFGNPRSVADAHTAFLADCARMDAPAVWDALARLFGKAAFDHRASFFASFVYRLSKEEKRQFLPQLASLASAAWKVLSMSKPGRGTKTSAALDQMTWARAAALVGVREAVEALARFAATGTPDVGSYYQEAQLKAAAASLQQVTGHSGDATPAEVGKWVLERLPNLKWSAAQMRYQ